MRHTMANRIARTPMPSVPPETRISRFRRAWMRSTLGRALVVVFVVGLAGHVLLFLGPAMGYVRRM